MTGKPHFNGGSYDHAIDQERLARQMVRIRDLMLDGQWRTLSEIAEGTGDPEASISAQLRHLRKKRFGAYVVELRARGDRRVGLFEYRVQAPSGAPDTRPRCPCCGRILPTKKNKWAVGSEPEVDPLS